MVYYNLYIDCKDSFELYQQVSIILGIIPQESENSKFSNSKYGLWWHQVEQEDSSYEPWIDFINLFLDMLEPNFNKLEKLGIKRSDILIWLVYENEGQCSLSFTPQEMKRLGESSINLNIDCHKIN